MSLNSTSWNNIRRSPLQTFAACLTMFFTFLLGGFFILTTVASVFILKYFESKPQIIVFFTDKVELTQVDELKKTLTGTGKVASIKYISKEEALEIYKKQNKNDPLLLEMVTADILPSSLEVSTKQPQFLKEIEPILTDFSGTEEVVYQKDVVDALLTWTSAIRTIGGIMVGFLGIDSFLIILTVIGLKISQKRNDIEILKLVGASPWYIRLPFLFEGSLYGMVGAISAWFVILGLILWFRPFLLSVLGDISYINMLLVNPAGWNFIGSAMIYLGLMIFLGLILGGIGSLVAVGRFLKL